MKIMFLDDDTQRMRVARGIFSGHELSEARTAKEAIRMLQKYSPYDLVSLDHDLGGEHFTPSDEKSGYEVAKFISTMPKELLPNQVIVHSYNFIGAQRMVAIIPKECDPTYVPFHQTYIEIQKP